MENGYIRLYRCLKDKGYYRDSEYVHLWVHLLLLASRSPREYRNGNKIFTLNSGELIAGRKQLSVDTGINEYKVERILKCFESEQQIAQQTFTKFRIISILNWEDYQLDAQQNAQQEESACTTKTPKFSVEFQEVPKNSNEHLHNNCTTKSGQKEEENQPVGEKVAQQLHTYNNIIISSIRDNILSTGDKVNETGGDVPVENNKPKQRAKREKPVKELVFPPELSMEVWKEYEEHRKMINDPLTNYKSWCALNSLKRIKENHGHEPNDVIRQSIDNCWTGLFPLRNQGVKNANYQNRVWTNRTTRREERRPEAPPDESDAALAALNRRFSQRTH